MIDRFSFRRFAMAVLCLLVAVAPAPLAAETAPDAPLALAADDRGLEWGPCPPLFPAGCEIAVLHGDPAKPNADIFFKVPAGYEIPSHWHTSAERMILVRGEMTLEYEGREPSSLKKGSYAYGPAKASHRGTCTGSEPCILFIAFESAVDAHAPE